MSVMLDTFLDTRRLGMNMRYCLTDGSKLFNAWKQILKVHTCKLRDFLVANDCAPSVGNPVSLKCSNRSNNKAQFPRVSKYMNEGERIHDAKINRN